jgi:L-asparaginase
VTIRNNRLLTHTSDHPHTTTNMAITPSRSSSKNGPVKPRIIIHGGAGNITKTSLPRDRYDAYVSALTRILTSASTLLSIPGISALDVATHAVSLLENDALFNSGHGAVFTREGHNELECSIMVSNGYKKRGVGCMMLTTVKNPIKLARELLIRGETIGGEAQDHCQYSGPYVESLAEKWGLDIVDPDYFWTKGRWEEHLRGLAEGREPEAADVNGDEVSQWEKDTYIPLGTCGAAVVDSFGTVCVATSTGGLTNKVPGRIGDTPTMGTGYWAEEWFEEAKREEMVYKQVSSPIEKLSRGDVGGLLGDCLPGMSSSNLSRSTQPSKEVEEKREKIRHAVAISGTGNGDSFIRMCAARSAAAYSRFSHKSLSSATSWMVGRGGELQKSAGDRWGKTHEGTGGMIGIEVVGEKANVVFDYNCGGLFRAWVDEDGKKKCLIFREDSWESGPEGWEDVVR